MNTIHIENTRVLAFSGDIHGEFKTIVNKLRLYITHWKKRSEILNKY